MRTIGMRRTTLALEEKTMADFFGKKDLGDGLVLRWCTPADASKLVDFHERIQGQGAWTRVLCDGNHPTTNASCFTVVEDAETGEVASSMCYIPQVWTYGGIPLRTARLEMVSTDPGFRMRGLARKQFDLIHTHTAARGYLLDVVVGKPWVYRKLGYTLALPYGGGAEISKQSVTPLPDGQSELFSVREASPDDIPFMKSLYGEPVKSYLVACVREAPVWRFEMLTRGSLMERTQHRIIVDRDGNRTGFLLHAPKLEDGTLLAYRFNLVPGASYLDATPAVLRYLACTGETYAAKSGTPFETLSLGMEPDHPIHRLTRDMLRRTIRPYAWYVRLPDLPSFVQTIAPVMERRIQTSLLPGYSGTLYIGFHEGRQGLYVKFTGGAVTGAGMCQAERFQTAMPLESFVKLVFGYRSVDELEEDYPEVQLTGMSRLLLETLFPKKQSAVLAIS